LFSGYRDRSTKSLTAYLSVLVGFMSKELMKIDSDSTFNGGFLGCTAGCATGSVTQVALTGYGYLY
jgi:glucan phosphorylase